MWVRKKLHELEADSKRADRQKFSPIPAACVGLFIGLASLPLRPTLGTFLIVALAVFAVAYALQVWLGIPGMLGIVMQFVSGPYSVSTEDEAYFCPKCQRTQPQPQGGCPTCGTPLEKLSRWRWAHWRSSRKKRA